MSSPEEAFGAELRRARLGQGLSQQELSFRANIHWSYVSQLERGIKSPSLGVLFRLAHALEVSASALIRATENRLSN